MNRLGAGLMVVLLLAASPAAALTERELDVVGVRPPPHARLDLSLAAEDQAGRATSLRAAAAGRPTVLVFADYRCRYLCGPALTLTADALARSGLRAGRDYRLVALSIDPRDRVADAAAFGRARLAAFPQVAAASALLVAAPADVARAAGSLGYRYRYDAATGQFAHMATAFVLAPDGRLAQALSNVQLQPGDLAAALAEAGRGEAPSFVSRLHALCYPFDPSRGVYNRPVQLALQLSVALALVGGMGCAWRIRRRRRR